MHDNNAGVHWREWGDDAFAEARAQDKPILLDIGAVWCHWCHVMDEGIPGDPQHTGTYSHPEVQTRIEANFIPIKVDNDRRPDVNARYNMGGWPTTAFLTPDGDTLYGETYVPPTRMVALLDHISDVWRTQKDSVAEQTAQMRAQRAADDESSPASELDPATVPTVVKALKRNFDFGYGGFGSQPKFPHPDAVLLAVEQHALTGDGELREIALKTMRGMANGGMYDHYAGGFFRYSTTRDWSIPHFEKMLEDNAKLTSVYALASQLLGDESLMDVVKSAHHWLLTDMRDPETGAFAGSQDADQEEHYYGQPLDVRATLPTPYIDRTIYAGWNALLVSSLVTRWKITGEPDILDAALQCFAFLRDQTTLKDDALRPLFHFHAGRAQGTLGLLADQTAFLTAALDLYEATGYDGCKETATLSADFILSVLADRQSGGFFDLPPDPNALGELALPKKELGENADAALALIRLSALTENPVYHEAAEGALKLFAGEYAQMSYFASSYARAVEAARRPALHIVIAGDMSDAQTRQLQRAAWMVVAPGKSVETLDAAKAQERGYPTGSDGTARAYVCVGTSCHLCETPEQLAALTA